MSRRATVATAAAALLAACDPCASLEARLDATYARWERRAGEVMHRDRQGSPFLPMMTEAEFAELADPQARCAPRPGDLEAVHEQLRRRAEAAGARAAATATLSLEPLRQDEAALRRFCRELPKGGVIHLHPRRSLDPESALVVLAAANPTLDGPAVLQRFPDAGWSERERAFLRQPPRPYRALAAAERAQARDLLFLPADPAPARRERVLATIALINMVFESPQSLSEPLWLALEAYGRRARALGVAYVEVSQHFVMTAESLRKLEAAAQRLHAATGVHFRFKDMFITSEIARAHTVSRQLEQVLTNAPRPRAFVGLDVGGAEYQGPELLAAQSVLAALRLHPEYGLHSNLHAARPDQQMFRRALFWGATRVAVGTSLEQDPLALEWARRRQLAVDVSLVSSYKKGAVQAMSELPFAYYLRLGLPVTLSTGDEGMVGSDLAKECEAAVRHSDLHYAELVGLLRNSIATSFAEPELKRELFAGFDRDLAAVEARWRPRLATGAAGKPAAP